MHLSGVWLPIITPFHNSKVDYDSYVNLIRHYVDKGINGLVPLGTTGELPAMEDDEIEQLIEITVKTVAGKIPVYVGAGGSATHKVVKLVKMLNKYNIDGYLAVCPYYNRPGQEGLHQHYVALSEATDKKIIAYNIPYRTAVNMCNETLFRLTKLKNIVGIKDSSGSLEQSFDLIANKPKEFSVLTGEDALFYTMLSHGAEGGILASSHIATEKFIQVAKLMQANKHLEAHAVWSELVPIVPLLFREPNPMPIKYCLWKQGLIKSQEGRLPMTPITKKLQSELDLALKI